MKVFASKQRESLSLIPRLGRRNRASLELNASALRDSYRGWLYPVTSAVEESIASGHLQSFVDSIARKSSPRAQRSTTSSTMSTSLVSNTKPAEPKVKKTQFQRPKTRDQRLKSNQKSKIYFPLFCSSNHFFSGAK